MMRKSITITIDGKVCHGKFGQTILQIARENGIYIPTMCYLTKVKPIGACRLCVVNVDGVDGMILSCQEKAVDGANIRTQSVELFKERQNIMKLYNVNHPLELEYATRVESVTYRIRLWNLVLLNRVFPTKISTDP